MYFINLAWKEKALLSRNYLLTLFFLNYFPLLNLTELFMVFQL
jgi:hypothetical protein